MKYKVQIKAAVNENIKLVSYETGKHDAVSDAEKELFEMIQTARLQDGIDAIELLVYSPTIVECYKDEMSEAKYG